MVKIHYVFDPLCGWCYGSTTLINELVSQGFNIALHPGGMLERQQLSEGFRQTIMHHDPRIEVITGQQFGEGYKAKLASGDTVIVDSYITAQAVLVMEQHYGLGIEMLKAIQNAHYQEGNDVASAESLEQLAVSLGADKATWANQFNAQQEQVLESVDHTRQLMANWRVGGFPSFVKEEDGKFEVIPHSQFYRKEASWSAWLQENAQ